MKFHRDLLQAASKREDINNWFTIQNTYSSNNTIKFSNSSYLEYLVYTDEKKPDKTYNNGKWANFTGSVTLKPYYYVMFRKRSNVNAPTNTAIGKFSSTANFAVLGKIMPLVYGDIVFTELDPTKHQNIFKELFLNATTLQSVSKDLLNSTNLTNSCYEAMFKGCTGLTSFGGSINGNTLYTLNDISYIANKCCYQMFYGCTGLTEFGDLKLNDLTTECCYQMFYGCSGLTKFGIISAKDFKANCCYQMFSDCSGLKTIGGFTIDSAGESCCNSMFYNCDALKDVSNITINATASSSCESMFEDCGSLENAPNISNNTKVNYRSFAKMFYGSAIKDASNINIGSIESGSTYQCHEMFYNCTSLITAPTLSLTTLANNCYSYMFYGCTSLTTAPALPATTLAQACYQYMFYGCTRLTYAELGTDANRNIYIGNSSCESMFNGCSKLNIKYFEILHISNYGCESMFKGCSKLTTYPKFNCTSFNIECCAYMFSGCTGLTSASLLVKSCNTYSFECMFSGCSGLTSAKNVEINNTYNYCCSYMFSGCTGLTYEELPKLNDKLLSKYCYDYMFSGCTGIKTIDENLLQATTLAEGCYNGMFKGCKITNLSERTFENVSKLEKLCFAHMFESATFTDINGVSGIPGNLLSKFTSLAENCYESMFQKSNFKLDDVNCEHFKDFLCATTLEYGCYKNMFYDCSGVKKLRKDFFHATTLADYCYYGMFEYCKNLTTVENDMLYNDNLKQYCYAHMFYGCTGLTSAPALPATTLASHCYDSMFLGCTSLTNVPEDYLPATTLASHCYYSMFYGCNNAGFTTTPKLPATDAKTGCYNSMFRGCSNIKTAKNIAITQSNNTGHSSSSSYGCYAYMFYDCTQLQEIDYSFIFSNPYHYDYYYMFYNCKNLPNPNFVLSSFGEYACYNMFYNTNITDASKIDITATTVNNRCCYGMFSGCNKLTTPPKKLPATTLADYCYQYMFQGCTSLTTAPELSAIKLANYCYSSMFKNCTNLGNTSLNPEANVTNINLFNGGTIDNNSKTRTMENMFYGCKNLPNPNFTLNNLFDYTCYYMFYNTNITDASSVTLKDMSGSSPYNTCESMFENCIYLEKSPNLLAESFGSGSPREIYKNMFKNCSSLKEIKCAINDSRIIRRTAQKYDSQGNVTLYGYEYPHTYRWVENVSKSNTGKIYMSKSGWDQLTRYGITNDENGTPIVINSFSAIPTAWSVYDIDTNEELF